MKSPHRIIVVVVIQNIVNKPEEENLLSLRFGPFLRGRKFSIVGGCWRIFSRSYTIIYVRFQHCNQIEKFSVCVQTANVGGGLRAVCKKFSIYEISIGFCVLIKCNSS